MICRQCQGHHTMRTGKMKKTFNRQVEKHTLHVSFPMQLFLPEESQTVSKPCCPSGNASFSKGEVIARYCQCSSLPAAYRSLGTGLKRAPIIQKCIGARETLPELSVYTHNINKVNPSRPTAVRRLGVPCHFPRHRVEAGSSWSRCPPRAAAPAAWPSWRGPAFPGPW